MKNKKILTLLLSCVLVVCTAFGIGTVLLNNGNLKAKAEWATDTLKWKNAHELYYHAEGVFGGLFSDDPEATVHVYIRGEYASYNQTIPFTDGTCPLEFNGNKIVSEMKKVMKDNGYEEWFTDWNFDHIPPYELFEKKNERGNWVTISRDDFFGVGEYRWEYHAGIVHTGFDSWVVGASMGEGYDYHHYINFTIDRADPADTTVTSEAIEYTGSGVKPATVVSIGEGEDAFVLTEGVDYTLSFSNNVNATIDEGDETVYAKTIATFLPGSKYIKLDNGTTQTGEFTITPRLMKDSEYTGEDSEDRHLSAFGEVGNCIYNRQQQKPTSKDGNFILKDDLGNVLVEGRDFDITGYVNNVHACAKNITNYKKYAPKLSIEYKGNYDGTSSTYFTIYPKDLSYGEITRDLTATPNGGSVEKIVNKDGELTYDDQDRYMVMSDFGEIFYYGYETPFEPIPVAWDANTGIDSAKLVPLTNYRSFNTTTKETEYGKKLTDRLDSNNANPNNSTDYHKYEYYVTWADNYDASSLATATLHYIGDYTGERTVLFTIDPMEVIGGVASPSTQNYTGQAITPAVSPASPNRAIPAKYYDKTYNNNVNVSTNASVTVKYKGNYTGSTTVYFTIKANNGASVDSNISDQAYTGKPIEPTIRVTGSGKTLVEGTDYTVNFRDNVNVGKATAEVVFKGNYSGSTSVTFNIKAKALTESGVTLDSTSFVYTGKDIKPVATVKDGNTTLKYNHDYTLAYQNNKLSGTATVIVTGKGNYSGKVEKTFQIAKAKYDMSGVTFDNLTVEKFDTIRMVVNGQLPKGVTVSYSGISEEVGSHQVTATFKGDSNYESIPSLTATLTVNQKQLRNTTVTLSKTEYTYNGTACVPTVTVKELATTLVNGKDYTVEYVDNVNAGTAHVQITAKGNYAGNFDKTFVINKAKYDMSGVSFRSQEIEEGEDAFTIMVISGKLPSGVTVSYDGISNEAGFYTVTANFTGDSNYEDIPSLQATLTVNAKPEESSEELSEDESEEHGEEQSESQSGEHGEETSEHTSEDESEEESKDPNEEQKDEETGVEVQGDLTNKKLVTKLTVGEQNIAPKTVDLVKKSKDFDTSKNTIVASYDVSLLSKSTSKEVQPTGEIVVSLPIPKDLTVPAGQQLAVLHVHEEPTTKVTTVTKVAAQIVGKVIKVPTKKLSEFVLILEPAVADTSEVISEPTSEEESEITSEPTSEEESEITSEPTSEEQSEPTSEPTSEEQSEPTSEPTSEKVSEKTSEPTSEKVSEKTSEPTSEKVSEPTSEKPSEDSDLTWLWILLGAVVVIAVVAVVLTKKKKSTK